MPDAPAIFIDFDARVTGDSRDAFVDDGVGGTKLVKTRALRDKTEAEDLTDVAVLSNGVRAVVQYVKAGWDVYLYSERVSLGVDLKPFLKRNLPEEDRTFVDQLRFVDTRHGHPVQIWLGGRSQPNTVDWIDPVALRKRMGR